MDIHAQIIATLLLPLPGAIAMAIFLRSWKVMFEKALIMTISIYLLGVVVAIALFLYLFR